VPQFLESVCRLSHTALLPLPHTESGLGHDAPQLVPLHVADPPLGTGQAAHDVAPHELVDVLLEHVPPHECVPEAHAHPPLWQVSPDGQAVPHVPQLLGSACKLPQVALLPVPQSESGLGQD
jgi:hypothetical protein